MLDEIVHTTHVMPKVHLSPRKEKLIAQHQRVCVCSPTTINIFQQFLAGVSEEEEEEREKQKKIHGMYVLHSN